MELYPYKKEYELSDGDFISHCPICASMNVKVIYKCTPRSSTSNEWHEMHVECMDCGCKGKSFREANLYYGRCNQEIIDGCLNKIKNKALSAWNIRKNKPAY